MVISAHHVAKCFRLGRVERYGTLRDSVARAMLAPVRFWHRERRTTAPESAFWALKDVSFEVDQGDVVGIIGRNGAGKSTLLKVLSRITAPTEGYIDIAGRVGTLLEVGTGFHPELTGRENIFLNGVILGMSRDDIRRQFDEIVSFAEIEQFVDTPVKRYSSGMYMRLAFGVAAHLQPEILIVDEVLAVGDAKFQEKCLGKMRDLGKSGRTVLFVSHNMGAIAQLCSRGILLKKGRIVADGNIKSVIETYSAGDDANQSRSIVTPEQHVYGADRLQLLEAQILNPKTDGFSVRWREEIVVEFVLKAHAATPELVLGVALFSAQGALVLDTHTRDNGGAPLNLSEGNHRIRLRLQNPLRAGLYTLAFGGELSLGKSAVCYVPDAARLTVLDVDVNGEPCPAHLGGIVNSEAKWEAPECVA